MPVIDVGNGINESAVSDLISSAVASLVNSAPGVLDTLAELATALGNDAGFAATIATALAGKASTSSTHSHAMSDITGLVSALAGKATPTDITTAINNLVNSAPGALDTLAELATALGNDASFATTITTALAGKQATLVSATNIKTIASNSIVGSGDLALTKTMVGLANVDNTTDAGKPVSTAQQTALDLKQDKYSITSIATAGATTTLTNASTKRIIYTGTLNQTCVLPVVSTLVLGDWYLLVNDSTGTVTGQTSGLNTLVTLATLQSALIHCTAITGTGIASWTYNIATKSVAGGLTNWTESNNVYSSRYNVKYTPNSAQANVDTVIQPKGTGAFYLGAQADGTATGGNNRGANAIDLQTVHTTNTYVASGSKSVILGGEDNTASATDSIAGGYLCNASGVYALSIGGSTSASAQATVALGQSTNASATGAMAVAYKSKADKNGQLSMGYSIGTVGARQHSFLTAVCQTTSTSNIEAFLDNSSARLTLANNQLWAFKITAIGQNTTNTKWCKLIREGMIYQVANAGSTVISTIGTLGTDRAAGSCLGAITMTADTTNGSLKIEANSGETATLNWLFKIELVEITT
ncbi:MAG: hypothetical protein NTW25_02260 [Candidatus Kapabacteria bacterium]|nr:hypothetical protein [Candidatus Kapabacteria bacterium]